jgi:hypothetical protein
MGLKARRRDGEKMEINGNNGGEFGEILNCSCCGSGVPNTPEGNVSFADAPYPHDTGYGLCRECGGEPVPAGKKASEMSEAELRKSLGWASCTFFDARIDVLLKKLNEANRTKFEKMSYAKKVAVVAGLIEKGAMI